MYIAAEISVYNNYGQRVDVFSFDKFRQEEKERYISGIPPYTSNSHHQDHYIFSREGGSSKVYLFFPGPLKSF